MSEIKPDDKFLINRDGVDYKATVDQFAKDINIHVECGGSGDGSSAVPTLESVLEVGNIAKPGQGIRFHVSEGDLPPSAKDVIDFEGGSELRLGGVASFYILDEPFTLDTDNGPTEFAHSSRRMSAIDDYYYASSNGETVSAGLGITGINYSADLSQVDVNSGGVLIRFGDYDNPSLKISASTYEGGSSITADEFIGDGSKLTGISSGGGSLDEIINAPVVTEVKYQLWEYFQGSYHSMGLTSGDGESGSIWKAANPKLDYYNNYGQSSIDGYIEYKDSASIDRPRASNCMAVIDDLVATAYSPDQTEIWSGDSATEEKVEIYVDQGFFHANALSRTEGIMGNPQSVVYLLELKFTNVHGEPETLWVDVHNYNYIAMRREDIDLREMEALDAEIKAKGKK